MSRMIDADALLTDRRMRMYYHLPNGDTAIPVIDIEHAPTIEERKAGKWISASVEDVGIFRVRTRRCTYCGERAIDGTSVAGATMDIINNFCPNCGADMRGGNK